MPGNEKEQVSTDELLPKWLDEEYFHDIISKKYHNYKILKFSVEAALAPGENYLSKLYRIKVVLKLSDKVTKHLCYILKAIPEGKQETEIINNMGVFLKEIQMYEKYIPKFESIYQKFGVNIKFAPKQYKLTPDVLVMEDLKSAGYENFNRHKGLDLKQSEAILEKLAKFHAASVCLYEDEGSYPDKFYNAVFPEHSKEYFDKAQENVPEVLVNCMREWKDSNKYIDKIGNFFDNCYELATKALKYNPNAFNVLNHGDLWINNIMFKYDDISDKLDDIQFVDLQLCKWGSPAHDLNYFIISSCSTEIKVKYFDYLIKYYHDQLISNLKLLKYSKPLPTLIDLHCAVIKCGHYAVISTSNVMAIALSKPFDVKDGTCGHLLYKDENSTNMRKQLFSNPRFIKAMEELLPFFDNRGYLDP